MTNEEKMIEVARIEAASRGMVYVGRNDAYEAFVYGKVIFDVDPSVKLLTEFCDANRSEFGDSIAPVRTISQSPTIYCTYNRALYKKRVEQKIWWGLEKEFPEADCWYSN